MSEGAAPASPAGEGFRWPAEWEPHRATWLVWPHNEETWPGRLAAVERVFARVVEVIADGEAVGIVVADARAEEHVRGLLRAERAGADAVEFVHARTDDAWVRDTGPIFAVRDRAGVRERVALDFRFDSWGGKYPPWDRDDALASRLAEALDLPCLRADFVLEGGSVDGDGRGTVLTTESCLLNPNRARGGPSRTRELVEAALADWLAAREVVWLADGIAGDDTDGHVDDLARFVSPGTVVTVVEDDVRDVNAAVLRENLGRLRAARDVDGKSLAVVALPMPPALVAEGERRPASYANFYLANGAALVPVFDCAQDERALAILAECLPGRAVVPIPARDLVVGLGAVHCLTQQEPA